MSLTLKPSADGLSAELQLGGVTKLTVNTTGIAGDGSQLTGLPTPAPSYGVPVWPYQSGRYYIGGVNAFSASGSGAPYGYLTLTPFIVHTDQLFSSICCYVGTLVAAKNIRLGVYADNNGVPGALLYDAGTASTATTGVKEITLNQTLAAGRYWLAFLTDATATLVVGAALNAYNTAPNAVLGTADPSVAYAFDGYYKLQAYGALPATVASPTLHTTAAGPVLYLAGLFLKAA